MNKRDEEILSTATKAMKGVKVKVTGDTATLDVKDGLYEELMMDGVDKDMVKKVMKNNTNYIDTVACLTSKISEKEFKKNKKVNTVTGVFDMEGGSTTIKVSRSKKFRSPVDGSTFEAPSIVAITKSTGTKGTKAFHRRLKDQLADSIAGK